MHNMCSTKLPTLFLKTAKQTILSLPCRSLAYFNFLMYQVIIYKLCRSFELDMVQYLLQQMRLEKVQCREEIMITLIEAYSQTGYVMQAVKTFYRANELGCNRTVRVYSYLFDALFKENRFSMISPLYSDMKRVGIEPNVYMYNILIKALCKSNRVEAAQKPLEEMPKKGSLPDEVSFTTVISSLCGFQGYFGKPTALSLCGSFRIKEAYGMLDEMFERGLQH